MTDPRIDLPEMPQDDPYGMDFNDDVLTAEEREELQPKARKKMRSAELLSLDASLSEGRRFDGITGTRTGKAK